MNQKRKTHAYTTTDPEAPTRLVRTARGRTSPEPPPPPMEWMRPRRRSGCGGLGCGGPGCGTLIVLGALLALLLGVYFLAPGDTTVLVLGMDYAPWYTSVARTDTLILASFSPSRPDVGTLSIPRDLWVNIPGQGENRINTAHFFAEAAAGGSGPQAALDTVQANFGVRVRYYVRIRFESVREIVNAMGGVDIDLPRDMAGYPAGRHHLTGNKALAFVRSRAGSDDFFRMQQGQLLIRAMLQQMLQPASWLRLPAVAAASLQAVDTNLPGWLWPRLGLALLRVGPRGIRTLSIDREDVTPYITNQGASVLLPNWERIQLRLTELFEG